MQLRFRFFSSSLHRSVSADSKCRCVEIFRCAKIKSERDLRGPAPFHNLLKEKKGIKCDFRKQYNYDYTGNLFFCIKFVSASGSRIAIMVDYSFNVIYCIFLCNNVLRTVLIRSLTLVDQVQRTWIHYILWLFLIINFTCQFVLILSQ